MNLTKAPQAAILLVAGFSLFAVPSFAKKEALPNLTKLCKKECPDAKDLKATMECVETKEHAGGPDSEAFKKTKCFITHEKHEDQYNKMAGLGHSEEEEHEKK